MTEFKRCSAHITLRNVGKSSPERPVITLGDCELAGVAGVSITMAPRKATIVTIKLYAADCTIDHAPDVERDENTIDMFDDGGEADELAT